MSGTVGKSQVGRGADLIIIDDPIPPSIAWKGTARNALIQWFDGEVIQRLNDKSNGVIILVSHRVHPEDLTHHLLNASDDWHVLSIPAIAIEDEIWAMPNQTHVHRTKGEALMPALMDRGSLRGLLTEIGASRFSAQYQQKPFIPKNPQEVRGGAFRHVTEDGTETIRFGTVSEVGIMLYELFGEGDTHPAEPPPPLPAAEEWSKKAQAICAKLQEEMARSIAEKDWSSRED